MVCIWKELQLPSRRGSVRARLKAPLPGKVCDKKPHKTIITSTSTVVVVDAQRSTVCLCKPRYVPSHWLSGDDIVVGIVCVLLVVIDNNLTIRSVQLTVVITYLSAPVASKPCIEQLPPTSAKGWFDDGRHPSSSALTPSETSWKANRRLYHQSTSKREKHW